MTASPKGTKHVCPECESKYYDLNKSDPVCPKCGAKPNTTPLLKSRPLPPRKAAGKTFARSA